MCEEFYDTLCVVSCHASWYSCICSVVTSCCSSSSISVVLQSLLSAMSLIGFWTGSPGSARSHGMSVLGWQARLIASPLVNHSSSKSSV